MAAYVTELRMIAKNCAHDGITPDEILRDRLVLGLRDDKVRERLLRINDLSLLKAVDICKAAEQTSQQLKMMNSPFVTYDVTNDTTVRHRAKEKDPTTQCEDTWPSPELARMQELWSPSCQPPVPSIWTNLSRLW